MKKFLLITSIIALFLVEIAHAQRPYVFKTKELEKYAPKVKTTPPTTIISRRFDKMGRETLVMKYYDDDTIDVYIYSYDKVGNLTENTSMLVAHSSRRQKRYTLVRYEKTRREYDDLDRVIKKPTFRKVTKEQYHEAMQKIIALLKEK